MNQQNKFQYITVKEYANFSSIEVTDIIGLVNLAKANKVRFIFTKKLWLKDYKRR